MIDARRDLLLRKLLLHVCRDAMWVGGRDAPVSRRLEGAIAAQRLSVLLDGVELAAWITPDIGLAVCATVDGPWTPVREEAVKRALVHDGSLVASLLSVEWSYVRSVCERASVEER